MSKPFVNTQRIAGTKKAAQKTSGREPVKSRSSKPPLSRGAIYLKLIGARSEWVHRRVETISFMANDSTKRRVSYDFTLASWAYPVAEGARIGVPITNMRKELLKSLSVTDANNKALSVWDTDQNGLIGIEVLDSLISGIIDKPLTDDQLAMVRRIVMSKPDQDVSWEVAKLCLLMQEEGTKTRDELVAAETVIEEFAKSFIFIVEVPIEYLDVRHIIKVSYDKEIDDAGKPDLKMASRDSFILKSWMTLKKFARFPKYYLSPVRAFGIESHYYASSASEHLEIHAPDDLQVTSLTRRTIDKSGNRSSPTSESNALGHVAHIHFKNRNYADLKSTSIVEFAPVIPGLLMQTVIATYLGLVLLLCELQGVNKLFTITQHPGDSGPFAAISLALPAFLLTLLARSREHNHVKEVLRTPRAMALCSTVILFISAASLVLEPSAGQFLLILRVLVAAQTATLLLMSVALDTVLKVNRQK